MGILEKNGGFEGGEVGELFPIRLSDAKSKLRFSIYTRFQKISEREIEIHFFQILKNNTIHINSIQYNSLMPSSNPHDTLIRQIFSHREDSISFLQSTLPKEVLSVLDLSGLEQTKESFIKNQENPTHTDILWKIPTKAKDSIFIYLLLEHKSYYDPHIYVQILGYLASIYTWQKENQQTLAPVIPFVFYHGEKHWNLGDEFINQFGNDDTLKCLIRYIPNFKMELLDLEKSPINEAFHSIRLKIFLSLIQKIRANLHHFRPIFLQALRELRKVDSEAKRIEILEKILYYLFSTREKDAKVFRDENLYRLEGLGEDYMTIIDEIKLEGKLEGKLEDAEKMISKGIPLSDVLEITGLSESDLKDRGLVK